MLEKNINYNYSREVLPAVQEFARRRCGGNGKSIFRHFFVPKFLYGAASTDTGEGVLVLEDLSVKGFSTFDPAMMLLDLPHMQVSLFFLFFGR